MQKLDAITAKAPGLSEFLKSPQLLEEYLEEAQNYYGAARLPKQSFDQIISQLTTLVKEIPELDQRLWKPQTSPASLLQKFNIEGSIKTSGRDLNFSLLEKQLADLKNKNSASAERYTNLSSEEQTAEIEKLSKSLSEKIEHFNQTLPKDLDRKQLGALKSQFFEPLKQNPLLDEMGSYYANQILNSENVQDAIRTQDPDVILNLINNQFHGSTVKFLENIPSSTHAEIVASVRRHLPKIQGEELEQIFPKIMVKSSRGRLIPLGAGAATYEITPFPRLFHRAFSGAVLGECIGGNCNYLQQTTPLRYLAPAGDQESVSYFVEGRGSYGGFVDLIPGKANSAGARPISYGIGSPVFSKNVISVTEQGNIRTPVWKAFQDEVLPKFPRSWKGLYVSDQGGADNAKVLSSVRNSDRYLFSDYSTGPFTMEDPLIQKIRNKSKVAAGAYDTGKGMILDATLSNAKLTRLLSREEELPENLLKRSEELLNSQDPTRAQAALDYLVRHELKDPQHMTFSLMERVKGQIDRVSNTNAKELKNFLKYESQYLIQRYPDELKKNLSFTLLEKNHPAKDSYIRYLSLQDSPLVQMQKKAYLNWFETSTGKADLDEFKLYAAVKSTTPSRLLREIPSDQRTRILQAPQTPFEHKLRTIFAAEGDVLEETDKSALRNILLDPKDSDFETAFQALLSRKRHSRLTLLDRDAELTYSVLMNPEHPFYQKLINDVQNGYNLMEGVINRSNT